MSGDVKGIRLVTGEDLIAVVVPPKEVKSTVSIGGQTVTPTGTLTIKSPITLRLADKGGGNIQVVPVEWLPYHVDDKPVVDIMLSQVLCVYPIKKDLENMYRAAISSLLLPQSQVSV